MSPAKYFALIAILLLSVAQAATIAIIDTGFDLDHEFLRPRVLKQETDEEMAGQDVVKDFHGWNFNDNSHMKEKVIKDQSLLQEILLFRNLKAKGHREGLKPEEFEWFKKKNADKNFLKEVSRFKKHSHGTIVAGIALREGENINIFPIRGLHIQSPVVAVTHDPPVEKEILRSRTVEQKFEESLKNSIRRVAKKFNTICHYIATQKIEVVNASYGITYKNIMSRFRDEYKQVTGLEIDEPKLIYYVNYYFNELYKRTEKTIRQHPRILFVFSAGNSGLDNDKFHHYPSRIKAPNTISVAAMNGEYLASFSNYGIKSVDVAAPGVGIMSLLPSVYSKNGEVLYSPASGTSMAAPYVSNLAAQILNANPILTPYEVKRIIFETGDKKAHLASRLSSGSVVDNKKALKAALLSLDLPIDQAIALSGSDIVPLAEDKISIGQSPAISAEKVLQQKVMDTIPAPVSVQDVEEEVTIEEINSPTKSESSSQNQKEKGPQDNLKQQPSIAPTPQEKPVDQVPSNQTLEQPHQPSEVETSSSPSEPEQLSPSSSPQNQESAPSSP